MKPGKLIVVLIVLFSVLGFTGREAFRNGIFKGISQSVYTDEPYYGHSTIKIEGGRIVSVEFVIRDSAKHVEFDDTYEKYFSGNTFYMDQCRNDRVGVRSYPDSLLKYQNIDKVDVISGATWSCNIFKASVKAALEQAE